MCLRLCRHVMHPKPTATCSAPTQRPGHPANTGIVRVISMLGLHLDIVMCGKSDRFHPSH